MPISPGLDATAAWQAAALAAQLGGSQANISAHLTRLKQSGLITSRTQGRAVYYRLAQPELGALLQAAGQLRSSGCAVSGDRANPADHQLASPDATT